MSFKVLSYGLAIHMIQGMVGAVSEQPNSGICCQRKWLVNYLFALIGEG